MTLTPERLRAVYQYKVENYAAPLRGHPGWQPGDQCHHGECNVTLENSLMDRLIDWKLRSPLTAKKRPTSAIAEGDHMIRQFTIELRVNYVDDEKNGTMRSAIAASARHMFATANLLADGVKPDIAIYSDDYFKGREEIELLQDVIQQGLDEANGNIAEGEVSSELMAAVRGQRMSFFSRKPNPVLPARVQQAITPKTGPQGPHAAPNTAKAAVLSGPIGVAAQQGSFGPSAKDEEQRSLSNQRFRSFAERYLVERCRDWPEDQIDARAWEAILQARSIYQKVREVGRTITNDT